jgi:hypothetical protein
MRLRSLGLGAALILLWVVEPNAAETISSSSCEPPVGLAASLSSRYPGAALVGLSDLDGYHRGLFVRDHGQRCPGLVSVDFRGNGKPTWALVLLEKEAAKRTARLLVATKVDEGWQVEQLQVAAEASPVPVVWREDPGKYVDFYGQKTLQAKHPAIVLCRYESWAILYAWTGKAVEKIWISD